MYGTADQDTAARLCAVASQYAAAPRLDARLVRAEVRQHSFISGGSPNTWGVWPGWVYVDMPEGPEFGGPFYPLDYLRALERAQEEA